MKIRFVSLISQDNRPLYIQAFISESKEEYNTSTPAAENEMNELLKYNFLSHMSLDVFESPFCPPSSLATQGKPSLLFVQDGILVYGLETQTGLKIVIGCSRYNNQTIKNNDDATIAAKMTGDTLGNLEGYVETDVMEVSDLISITSAIKKEYLRYCCNPFLDSKTVTEIKSEKFDKNIKGIIDEFNFNHV
jgi:hypothetical protein